MAVAALSTAGISQYVLNSSSVVKSQQAFQALQQSLASGNLSAAQTAFKTYQQLNQNVSTTSGASVSSQLSTDLTALGTAISSGSLSSAQSAFATVQNDLKSAPSQAVAAAQSAAAQSVQWVDDLLNFPDSSSTATTSTDPTSAILDSAYGLNPSSSTTDPTTALLESKYGSGTAAGSAAPTATAPTIASSGNSGSGASVNVYA